MQQPTTKLDLLLQACQNNDSETVARLIKEGANPHAQYSSNESVIDIITKMGKMSSEEKLNYKLFSYSGSGNIKKIKLFLALGANVNAKGSRGETPLHDACQYGHLEVVKELIRVGANCSAKNSNGDTPLHDACQYGHLEVVKELIKVGANCSAKNSNGDTPINYACIDGNLNVVKELIEKIVDVNVENSKKVTPLHDACQYGHLEVVKELIKAGANCSAKNSNGDTPLYLAFRDDHFEVVKELIRAGVDLEDKNNVISIATSQEAQIMPQEEDRLKVALISNSPRGNAKKVKLLLALGGDVNQVDSKGFTLLHIASLSGNLQVVKTLISAGADVNAQNQNQKTVKFVVINPSPEESSAKPPVSLAFSPFGTEPLHVACTNTNDNSEIVKELIKAGANVNAKSSEVIYKVTPLHLACEYNNLGS